jgi:hypothetical protein
LLAGQFGLSVPVEQGGIDPGALTEYYLLCLRAHRRAVRVWMRPDPVHDEAAAIAAVHTQPDRMMLERNRRYRRVPAQEDRAAVVAGQDDSAIRSAARLFGPAGSDILLRRRHMKIMLYLAGERDRQPRRTECRHPGRAAPLPARRHRAVRRRHRPTAQADGTGPATQS